MESTTGSPSAAPQQYLAAGRVIDGMSAFGRGRVEFTVMRTFILAVLGGGFITAGGLFSVLLGTDVEQAGPRLLIEGFAFSAGFLFVILSEAVLFTEANVVLPAMLLADGRVWPRVVRFWVLAWIGNLAGAWLFGHLIASGQLYSPEVLAHLDELIEQKLAYRDIGGVAGWSRIVLSGVLANWLVGMAAFFAFMGRTIVDKYVPVLLAVTLFVAAGFQHSPANMGYFALHLAHGGEGSWLTALGWNIVPAGVGNMLGAALLVAVPYWFVFQRPEHAKAVASTRDAQG